MAALLLRSRLYEGIFNHLVASGKEPPLWICGEQARSSWTIRRYFQSLCFPQNFNTA